MGRPGRAYHCRRWGCHRRASDAGKATERRGGAATGGSTTSPFCQNHYLQQLKNSGFKQNSSVSASSPTWVIKERSGNPKGDAFPVHKSGNLGLFGNTKNRRSRVSAEGDEESSEEEVLPTKKQRSQRVERGSFENSGGKYDKNMKSDDEGKENDSADENVSLAKWGKTKGVRTKARVVESSIKLKEGASGSEDDAKDEKSGNLIGRWNKGLTKISQFRGKKEGSRKGKEKVENDDGNALGLDDDNAFGGIGRSSCKSESSLKSKDKKLQVKKVEVKGSEEDDLGVRTSKET
ncbi:lysine-specific demethylase JMJ25-like [Abeliophyllum distichum]|uniref:Lysine-specific demethylase JMJ25-like n=1 Tax=Abeliophyllum distichum TaxID=126358 RepID=A0ABD1SEE4_9LAMI